MRPFRFNIDGHLCRGYAVYSKGGNSSMKVSQYLGGGKGLGFVFTGLGSQWIGVGRSLMKIPKFAETIDK